MRLDKFLQVSRLVKRRTVAKQLCDAGKVYIGSRCGGAGDRVKVGDVISIDFGLRVVKVEVLRVEQRISPREAAELYRVIEVLSTPRT